MAVPQEANPGRAAKAKLSELGANISGNFRRDSVGIVPNHPRNTSLRLTREQEQTIAELDDPGYYPFYSRMGRSSQDLRISTIDR